MAGSWSPYPRYRLYTTRNSYDLPLIKAAGAVEQFEAKICTRFKVAAAVCVPMARSGLYFTLREMVRPGQKVVLSPLTIVDVVNAVILAGCVPVFADIRRESCAIDPDIAESLIDSQTGAILITHLHGETAGAHEFREIASRRGIRLIEDAAQAFGAVENETRLGTIGDVGIYSFGFYKNLMTWRGGMLVSNDTVFINRVRTNLDAVPRLSRAKLLMRSAAGFLVDVATWPPVFSTVTFPIVRQRIGAIDRLLDPEAGGERLDEVPQDWLRQMRQLQAAIGIRNMDRIDIENRLRIEKAHHYHDGLDSLDRVICPARRPDLSHIYTYFPIQIGDRKNLLVYAQKRRRDFAAKHLRNCADLPMFAEFYRDCPNARAASQELVLLPTYPSYPESEIQNNVQVLRDFANQSFFAR
jgi:dTDP-4-amino-4,6-dideoxygalactose transaminase